MLVSMFSAPKTRMTDDMIRALPIGRDAKSLAHYLADKPDGWRVVTGVCMSVIGRSDKTTLKAIKELVGIGLVQRMPIHDAIAGGRLRGAWEYDAYGPGRHKVVFCCNPSDPAAVAAVAAGYRLVCTENARVPWSVQDHGKRPLTGFPERSRTYASAGQPEVDGRGNSFPDFYEDSCSIHNTQENLNLACAPASALTRKASPEQEQERLRFAQRQRRRPDRQPRGEQATKGNRWYPYRTTVGAHRDSLLTAYWMWARSDADIIAGSQADAWRAAAVEVSEALSKRSIPKELYGHVRAIAERMHVAGIDPSEVSRDQYLRDAYDLYAKRHEGFIERNLRRGEERIARELAAFQNQRVPVCAW